MKLGLVSLALPFVFACASPDDVVARGSGGSGGGGGNPPSSIGGAGSGSGGIDIDVPTGCASCASGESCADGKCVDACALASEKKSSVGCEYYAVAMAAHGPGDGGCFAAFVANGGDVPAHVSAEFQGKGLDLAAHARVPVGNGPTLSYAAYDPAVGILPGETVIVFLSYFAEHKIGGLTDPMDGGVTCPVPAAVTDGRGQFPWSGHGHAFHLTTDQPVVAYQMMPYGGGSAAITGATLLIPTTAWDTNYLAAEATKQGALNPLPPTMNIVAMQDATQVTFVPNGDIAAWGMGSDLLSPSPKNQPVTWLLDRGEHIQLVEMADFTGSPIESDKPIGVFGGHYCMNLPNDTPYCDHAEQQIPAIRALGSEYVAVGHRDRTSKPENRRWRIVGAVDDTQLVFQGGGPGVANVGTGSVLEFQTDEPFVVKSQDQDHPFLVFAYMTSSLALDMNYGDPDFVRVVPPAQYLDHYVFFTDPTYPETNLVVVRQKGAAGFEDVTLDCAGTLGDWTPVGTSGDYEYTRIDLVSHDFVSQNGCNTGRREMSSNGRFGVWVWGWGTPETSQGECDGSKGIYTCHVSYGYPAGESVATINDVYVPPIPR